MSHEFKGVWTAIVTPFTSQGHLDTESFERLLNMQKEAGVQGVVVSGTTGESPTLSVQEKISLVRKARAFLPTSIKVMAGTGGNNTEQSVELSRLAEDAGADSLLIVTPPYNKPTIDGLKGHFGAISQATKIPLCLYHVPGRTAQTLSAEAIAQICEIPRVVAVKEASANMELFSKAKILSKAKFLSGDDGTYLASLAVGGSGVISVVTNLLPKAFVALTKAFSSEKNTEALQIHESMLDFIQFLFVEANPSPIKAALAAKGLCKNSLRLPLAPMTAANEKRLLESLARTEDALKKLGIDG